MMALSKKDIVPNPKIEEIENLYDLKEYSCPRYRHMNEWYMNCIDCASLKTCRAGQQANKLMEMSTAPFGKEKMKEPEFPDPKTNLTKYIEWVFTSNEPVKILLKTSGNIRPQSVYARVNLWRKNYPDLEKKYRMIEKVRFLWTKPYSTMKIEDILKKLYPEEGPANDFNGKYSEYQVVNVPEKKEDPIMKDIPVTTEESGEISLEDFLKDNTVSVINPVQKSEKICEKSDICEKSAEGNDSGKLDLLLEKLRKNVAEYERKIQEMKEQIAAVLTVQKLMKNGM